MTNTNKLNIHYINESKHVRLIHTFSIQLMTDHRLQLLPHMSIIYAVLLNLSYSYAECNNYCEAPLVYHYQEDMEIFLMYPSNHQLRYNLDSTCILLLFYSHNCMSNIFSVPLDLFLILMFATKFSSRRISYWFFLM